MPKGIYKRTKRIREAIRRARLGNKASKETKKKMSLAARRRAQDPQWLINVSLGVRKAMHRSDVRKKHLEGLRRARKLHGINFKGGNGQRPTKFVRDMERMLRPLGYVREYAIGIPSGCYKVDFGLPSEKIAIECDGPCHRSFARKKLDEKKDKVLKNLGWRIIRVRHD